MRRGARLGLAALLLAAALGAAYLGLPKPDLAGFHGYSRAYLDRHGRLLRLTLAGDDRYRLYTPLTQIAPALREATLLYEDRGFYRHPGVDPLALLRAGWTSYVTRARPVGASTITMQVARLRWNLQTRTLGGKLRQILRALQLGRHYGRDEIFEAYLNLASYGRNIEGVEAASLIYFGKHAAELELPEALALSVIPQNPTARNPTSEAGRLELLAARARLFAAWLEEHPEDAGQQALFDLPLAVRPPETLPFRAPHFVASLDQELPALRRGALLTTLDAGLQVELERRVAAYVDRRRRDGIANAAVALLDYRNMDLLALVGSADFFDPRIEGQVNGAAARRSPGSALKPFVYALALDQQLIHPLSLLKDAPHRYSDFNPENYDSQFLGPVFARQALIASRNVPAVQLQAQLQNPGLYDFLREGGVSNLREEGFYGLALTLGGVELSMLELLRLYALLPNGGTLRALRTLRDAPAEVETPRLLSPEASYLVLDMLRDNPPPDGGELPGQSGSGPEVAWKTGTSYAFRDAWAIGVSGPYVAAVWVGNFSGAGNPAFIGRQAAGPLLFEILRGLANSQAWQATGDLDPGRLNLRQVQVCALTGELPGRSCPQTVATWFIPGVSPIRVCSVHRSVPIDPASGLRACAPRPGRTSQQVFEFWPSDLERIFRQAGIGLKSPPPYGEECTLDQRSGGGEPPAIWSPQAGVDYRLREEDPRQEPIPFVAVSDADVRELFWFVDDRFVGRAASGETFFWTPSAGHFTIRVVDDQGRAAQLPLRVGRVREPRARQAP